MFLNLLFQNSDQSGPLSPFCWLAAVINVVTIIFCERAWRRQKILHSWYGRLSALCTLTFTNSYLLGWVRVVNMFLLVLVYGSSYFIWFVRGYGYGVIDPSEHKTLTIAKQWLLGIFTFTLMLSYLLCFPTILNDSGLILWAETLPSWAPNFLFWLACFLWAIMLSEGCLTYSNFDDKSVWLKMALLQHLTILNSLIWGNQFCEFASTYGHPRVIELCAEVCIVRALCEIIREAWLWLKTKAQYFTNK